LFIKKGCGPASISCATFLARLGYENITVFERSKHAGGLSSSEIPQYRLPYEAVEFELQLMLDLGVRVEYDRQLGRDFTLESLREQFESVFIGIGLPQAKRPSLFDGLDETSGFFTSKDFLPKVSNGSKPGLCACKAGSALPSLSGKQAPF
jgi:dihydropyrimidine dehydrogenase (NADP+)